MRGDFFFFLSYFFLFFSFFFLGGRSWVLKIPPSGPQSSVVRLYIYIYIYVCVCMCVCLMKRKGGLSVRGLNATLLTLCFD